MLKILGRIAIVLAVVVGTVLAYAAMQPDSFKIQRTTSIKAAPEKIFPLISDFAQWPAWSPYENKDPAMKRTLAGTAGSKGATYAWDGNGDVGAGRMTIADAAPPRAIKLNLDFTRPFEAHNLVEFTIEPKGDSSVVTWAMNGPMPYISKVMCLFFDMDAMVGKDFETGLASLKQVAER